MSRYMSEIQRVLRPGAYFHLWDVDLSERPETDKEYYIVFVHYTVGDFEIGTGYGHKWPDEERNVEYYIDLAEEFGFKHISTERNEHLFHLIFKLM